MFRAGFSVSSLAEASDGSLDSDAQDHRDAKHCEGQTHTRSLLSGMNITARWPPTNWSSPALSSPRSPWTDLVLDSGTFQRDSDVAFQAGF